MKYVLIVMMSAGGGSGMSMWQQPALSMVSFEDKLACDAATNVIGKMERESGLRYVKIAATCVPAATEAK